TELGVELGLRDPLVVSGRALLVLLLYKLVQLRLVVQIQPCGDCDNGVGVGRAQVLSFLNEPGCVAANGRGLRDCRCHRASKYAERDRRSKGWTPQLHYISPRQTHNYFTSIE